MSAASRHITEHAAHPFPPADPDKSVVHSNSWKVRASSEKSQSFSIQTSEIRVWAKAGAGRKAGCYSSLHGHMVHCLLYSKSPVGAGIHACVATTSTFPKANTKPPAAAATQRVAPHSLSNSAENRAEHVQQEAPDILFSHSRALTLTSTSLLILTNPTAVCCGLCPFLKCSSETALSNKAARSNVFSQQDPTHHPGSLLHMLPYQPDHRNNTCIAANRNRKGWIFFGGFSILINKCWGGAKPKRWGLHFRTDVPNLTQCCSFWGWQWWIEPHQSLQRLRIVIKQIRKHKENCHRHCALQAADEGLILFSP